jgi:hypothetical protein
VGFKDLTPDNWDEPDEVSQAFIRLSPVDGVVGMSGGDWARAFLRVELSPGIPDEICDLFAAARGVLVYGWFFYPLFVLGEDQLHRVAEAAAKRRYRDLGGTRARPTFAEAIEWLVKRGAIRSDEERRWTAMRDLRNTGSHPDFQMLMPPGEALETLSIVADAVNELFAGDQARDQAAI